MRASSWFLLILLAGLPACATLRNTVFRKDPLSCEEHAELGTSYAEQNMTADAEKEFRTGFQEKKDCTPSQTALIANNLAMIELGKGKNLDEAERLAQGALENAGAFKPYVLDTLAGIYAKTGRIEKARQALDQADAIAPVDNKPLRDHLADSRKKLLGLTN